MSLKHLTQHASSTISVASVTDQQVRLDAQAVRGISDSLESQSRLIDSMKSQTTEDTNMSTWIRDYKIPDKATLEASYNESRAVAFGNAQLVESHKSKRKDHYMEKAKLQTFASKTVKDLFEDRSHGPEAFFQAETRATVSKEDVSFLQDWSTYLNQGEYASGQLMLFSHFVSPSDIEEKRMEAVNLAGTILGFDITKLEYSNDEDFLQKFRQQYERICAFSNSQKIIDFLEESTDYKKLPELKARVRAINDIREDYENKMQIMQSPYYALLMESDIEGGNLERVRIEKADNPVFKAYYEAVMKRSEMKFKKGQSAAELEAGYLAEEKKKEEEMAPEVEISVMLESHKSLQEKEKELLDSKKVRRGKVEPDSEEMSRLKESIKTLNSKLDSPIAGLTKGDLIKQYETVIANCDAYKNEIWSHFFKGRSSLGQRRTELVAQIKGELEKELMAFSGSDRELELDKYDPAARWADVLYGIRAIKVSESNPKVKTVGAGTSRVYRIEQKGSSVYVKQDEKIAPNQGFVPITRMFMLTGIPGAAEMGQEVIECLTKNPAIMEKLDIHYHIGRHMNNELPPEDGEDFESFQKRNKDHLKAVHEEVMRDFAKLFKSKYIDEHMDQFVEWGMYYYRKENEFITATESAQIAPKESMSNRNVSSSRLAKKLGLSSIVAESKTVVLRREDGSVTRANAMEGVETLSLSDLKTKGQMEKKQVLFSAEAMGQLVSLQIFDMICGQTDRHPGNYNVFFEENDAGQLVIKSVKAIDNDMAFGMLTRAEISGTVDHLRTIYDHGNLTIPFIDKALYESIVANQADMITTDQQDIRSADELGALQDRYNYVRDTLIDLVEVQHAIQLVDGPEGWTEAARQMGSLNMAGKLGYGYLGASGIFG